MLGLPSQVTGILGLALGSNLKDKDIPQEGLKISPKFYDYLYMAGGITEKLFSTHLEGVGGNSFVDFGPINLDHMSGLEEAVTISFDNGYFWNLVPQGIRFGEEQDQLEFNLDNTNYMILSSSTAFNFVPKNLADDFFYNLFNKFRLPYTVSSGMFIVECTLVLPSIHFLLGDYWVTVSSSDMLIDISPNNDRSLCVCTFLPSQDEIWVLGQSLYKDYYMTHNPDKRQITFTPTEKRIKAPLKAGVQPRLKFTKAYNWTFFLIKFGGMLAMAGATYGFIKLIETCTAISFLESASQQSYKEKH